MSVPSVRELIPRTSFVDAVSSAIRTHRLIVIQAPAGYGKTSAGALTVVSVGLPTVWYTAQPWHAGNFIEPLVDEVRTVRDDFGRLTLALAAHGRPPSDDADALRRWVVRIGASFAQELGHIPERLVLVIEDYHMLEGDLSLSDFISGAMRQLPETVNLLLVGRSTPSLPLTEWVTQRRAVIFNADDLKFNTAETMLLARRSGAGLQEQKAAELCTQCEGWPAGISVLVGAGAKSSVQRGRAASVPATTDLIEHHVATLPNEMVEFLERTAVLDTLEASVLEQHGALAAARPMLRDLERRGEMLSVLRSGDTYRLHPLMREALLDRVKDREGEPGVARLHAWAGEMFEAAGRHAPALFHLERARDEIDLVRFLTSHVEELFADGHAEQAARAVRDLTKRGVDVPILVGRVQGMLLRRRGSPGARELLLTALRIAKERGDDESVFALRVQLLWDTANELDSELTAEVGSLARDTDSLGTLQKATALVLLGWTRAIAADFSSALGKAAAAAELGAASPEVRFRAALLYAYAATCLGDFAGADSKMSELLRDLEPSEHVVLLCCTLFWYARLSLAWGDIGAAEDYARRGTALGRHLNLQAELASVYSALVEIHASAGDRESCTQAAATLSEHAAIAFYSIDRKRMEAHAQQMLARCAFVNASPADALAIVQAALANANPPPTERAALHADAALYLALTESADAPAARSAATEEVRQTVPFDVLDACKLAAAGALLELMHGAVADGPIPALHELSATDKYRSFVASRRDLADLYDLAGVLQRLVTDADPDLVEDAAKLSAGHERLGYLKFRFEAAAIAALLRSMGRERLDLASALRSTKLGWADGQPEKKVAQSPRGAALTKRELEVLGLMARDLTYKEIAQRLALSVRTIETHVEHVLGKLNARSRTRAVAIAVRAGLLSATVWEDIEEEESA